MEPSISQSGDDQVLSMKLKVSETEYLEYRYALKPGEYMTDFNIRSQGLASTFNASQPINLDWQL